MNDGLLPVPCADRLASVSLRLDRLRDMKVDLDALEALVSERETDCARPAFESILGLGRAICADPDTYELLPTLSPDERSDAQSLLMLAEIWSGDDAPVSQAPVQRALERRAFWRFLLRWTNPMNWMRALLRRPYKKPEAPPERPRKSSVEVRRLASVDTGKSDGLSLFLSREGNVFVVPYRARPASVGPFCIVYHDRPSEFAPFEAKAYEMEPRTLRAHTFAAAEHLREAHLVAPDFVSGDIGSLMLESASRMLEKGLANVKADVKARMRKAETRIARLDAEPTETQSLTFPETALCSIV